MTALTGDRATPKRVQTELDVPVAAGALIYAGSIVCINTAGFAVKGAPSTTLKVLGVSKSRVDNTSGANGDQRARVERGTWQFGNSASTDQLTQADIGSTCYVVDDQTVAKTNGTNTRIAAGTVRDVDANGVWVGF